MNASLVVIDGETIQLAMEVEAVPEEGLVEILAPAIVACDFFMAVTSTFRVLYVLVVIEHHSRRLIHYNVTAHPSAQWTRQQLREAVGYESRYQYLIHDRDSIFSADLDESIQRLGLRVLKSPPRSPLRTRSVNA